MPKTLHMCPCVSLFITLQEFNKIVLFIIFVVSTEHVIFTKNPTG